MVNGKAVVELIDTQWDVNIFIAIFDSIGNKN